jgi:hypothetical protein
MPPNFEYRWVRVPADPQRESGWPEALEKHLIAVGVLEPSSP